MTCPTLHLYTEVAIDMSAQAQRNFADGNTADSRLPPKRLDTTGLTMEQSASASPVC
jgi:hypothetical protein